VTRRLAISLILLSLLAGGCAKQQWNTSERLTTLRENDDYTLNHAVAQGETLRSIADLYYGDPDRAEEIALINNVIDPDLLAVGEMLELRFTEQEWTDAEGRRAALDAYNDGVAAMRAGSGAVAEDAFRRALSLDPDLEDAQYNLALVWMRRGRNEDAEAMLLPLADRHPDDLDVQQAYGQSLFYQARFDEAVTVFSRILQENPDHRDASFSRASALGESGRRAEAVDAWRSFLRRHPSGTLAERARAELRELTSGG